MTDRNEEQSRRVVTLPCPQPAWIRRLLVLVCRAGLVASLVVASGASSPAISVALAALCLAGITYGSLGFRTLRVARRGRAVLIPGKLPLPAGEGDVIVEAWIRYVSNGRHRSRPMRCYRISHSGSAFTALYPRCDKPLAARSFAEGLCRLGGYRLLWKSSSEEPPEVRETSELNRSLAERLSAEPKRMQASTQPYDPLVEWEGLPGGAVRLWRPLRPHEVFLVYGVALGLAALAGSLGWLASASSSEPLARWWFLGVGLPGLATATGWLALRKLVSSDLVASPAGVERRWRLLGGKTVHRRLWASRRIESLYLESQPLVRLILAGDDLYKPVYLAGRGLEPVWVRYLLQRGLLGLGVRDDNEAPIAARGPTAAAQRGGCPRCLGEPLAAGAGELDEEVCATCAGRYLPPHGAERLVLQELAISRQMLRELVGIFGGERLRCPGCGTRMSAVQLKGVATDLCTGCGGVWLDAEELTRLSLGRYSG